MNAHDGAPPATGFEYLYFDPRPVAGSRHPKPLSLSQFRLNQAGGCFFNTISQLISGRPQMGRILYDDEVTGIGQNPGRGHCKGVLGFDLDSDSAFWMVHSTPRYPSAWMADFPEFEVIYGQTFLCITLPDIKTLEDIAAVLTRQHEPWVFGVRLPEGLSADSPLRALAAEDYTNESGPHTEVFNFKSRSGHRFRLIAKNARWGKDFWNELVCDELSCDLNVETWRRGTVAANTDDRGRRTISDVQSINLEPIHVHYTWPYTRDHAKWAVALKGSRPWICVGDINRDTSQARRGGGTIAFQQRSLWDSLSRIEQLVPVKAAGRKASSQRKSGRSQKKSQTGPGGKKSKRKSS